MFRFADIFVVVLVCVLVASGSVAAETGLVSAAEDRVELSLAIYNNNLALVRERRRVNLERGRTELRLADVGRMLLPSSVIATPGQGVRLVEQRYLFNRLNRSNLLDAYLGREVIIETKDERSGVVRRRRAKILANDGGPVVEVDGEVLLAPDGKLVFPKLPEALVAEPVLSWLVESSRAGEREINFSYLTNGVSWQSEYVLTVEPDQQRATLGGWVTLRNNSGADFRVAQIHLLAGEINREAPGGNPGGVEMRASLAAATADAGAIQPSEQFEYYRYDLPGRTDLLHNQAMQVQLFAPRPVDVEKVYRLNGSQRFFRSAQRGRRESVPAEVILNWKAAARGGGGQPLPAGLVRIYERGGEGTLWFAGEDRIGHVSAGEKVSVRAGRAFDVRGVRRQLDFQRLSDRLRRVTVEIELINGKDTAVTVQVDESLPGDWKMIEQSHEMQKLESGLVRFNPRVPAGSRVKVSYTIEFI